MRPSDEDIPPDVMDDDLAPPETDELDERRPMPVQSGGFLEYRAPDGAMWRCDRCAELFSDFTISGSAADRLGRMEEWHRVMSPLAAAWPTLRRLYRVAPLTGSLSAEELREWSREDIARALSVSLKLLDEQLQAMRDFWHRTILEKSMAEKAASSGGGLAELDDRKAEELLNKHGFAQIPEAERKHVARRILEISHLFELPEGRMLAQSAIFQELVMRHLQKEIAVALSQAKVDPKALNDLYERLMGAQKTYEDTLKKLGGTQEQNPHFRAKVAFNDSIGHLTKSIQAYYADHDTALIDGIFTESEVLLQLTATTLRPIQYRPDLVLLAQDWKSNFWNPDYEAAKLPRGVMRRLLKGFEAGVRAQMLEEGEQPPDMEDGGDLEVLDMAEQALETPANPDAPTDDLSGGGGMVMPAERGRGGQGRDEVVAI